MKIVCPMIQSFSTCTPHSKHEIFIHVRILKAAYLHGFFKNNLSKPVEIPCLLNYHPRKIYVFYQKYTFCLNNLPEQNKHSAKNTEK